MQDLIFNFQSDDDSVKGSALEIWTEGLKEAFGSKGIDLTSVSKYRSYLESAGFEKIKQEEFRWPVGTWSDSHDPKKLGSHCQTNILDMRHAISIIPLTTCQTQSMPLEAVELLLEEVKKALLDPNIHAYLQM